MIRLPDYWESPPPPFVPPTTQLSRPSASAIREASPTVTQLSRNETAANKPARYTYGEDRIAGWWLTNPVVSGGNLVFAMYWSEGEIEGVQQVYINGAVVPGGVTMTHYTGAPGQGIDPTLNAALAGFGDVYAGMAYTVFSVPVGTIQGFPQQRQIEAVVRGIKVYDPRTDTTAWTQNPALCMADLAERMGKPAQGVAESADRCDEVVNGSIRCEIGLTILRPVTEEANLDLMAAYAEVLWSYAEDGIVMVPDAPVDEPAAIISASEIVEGTFQIQGHDALRLPTSVTATYRQPSGGVGQWTEANARQALPGVDAGEIADIPSDLAIIGVHRQSEANRKALMRLRRLSYPTTYAWQAMDSAVRFQRGDVVQLPESRGRDDRLVRILSCDLVRAGHYQITAERYSADMYAFDFIPGSETSLPVGAIIPFSGSEAPEGFEEWGTEYHDRVIFGAGGDFDLYETGGSTSFTLSGTTVPAGAHIGQAGNVIGPQPGLSPNNVAYSSSVGEGDHAHSFSLTATYHPQRRRLTWIRKTGAPGSVPMGGGVFADGPLISPFFSESTVNLGRLCAVSGTGVEGNTGFAFTRSYIFSFDPAGGHGHFGSTATGAGTIQFSRPTWSDWTAVPNHTHSVSAAVEFAIARSRCAYLLSNASAQIVPGCIVAFDGDIEALPPGWHLCDGDNGTVNLTGRSIELSSSGAAGVEIGSNTVSVNALTNYVSHKHMNVPYSGGYASFYGALHDNDIPHRHQFSASAPYMPPYVALYFIQYTGVV